MRNESPTRNNRWLAPVLLVITALGLLGPRVTPAAATVTGGMGPQVDLTTDIGATLMQATWRYRDARIVETLFPSADAAGQPNWLIPGIRP